MGQIRRILSCTFVRAQSLCLLARLGQVGPRARGAAERRAVVQRLEWARKREAEGLISEVGGWVTKECFSSHNLI